MQAAWNDGEGVRENGEDAVLPRNVVGGRDGSGRGMAEDVGGAADVDEGVDIGETAGEAGRGRVGVEREGVEGEVGGQAGKGVVVHAYEIAVRVSIRRFAQGDDAVTSCGSISANSLNECRPFPEEALVLQFRVA